MSLRRIAKVSAIVFLGVPGAIAMIGALPECGPGELPAGVEGRLVRVLGTRLRVDQRGRGRDILLIHGSPGALEDWQPIRERLARS